MRDNVLNNILNLTGGEKFYRFGNSDGKFWVVPARGMRTAMSLYQPSGRKGKMVKSLLPSLHWIAFVRRAIHAETLHCRLNKEIHKLLCEIFNTNEIDFAIFEGTPSVHKKITMQLSCGKQVLGYCKLSCNEEIGKLFEKETDILRRLAEREITNIPEALCCTTLDKDLHIFVQSTAKTTSSKIPHRWNNQHEEFLEHLHEKTKRSILFEESDYYRTLAQLEEHIDWLPDNIDTAIIAKAIDTVKRLFCNKKVEFSAFHGDFTPWNMFVEKGKLFLFDFEYAAMSYPRGLDRYHFFTQTAIFENGWDVKDIISYINSTEGSWVDRSIYTLYLIDIISRFTVREKKKVTGEETEFFRIWADILQYIQNS